MGKKSLVLEGLRARSFLAKKQEGREVSAGEGSADLLGK